MLYLAYTTFSLHTAHSLNAIKELGLGLRVNWD